MRTQLLKSVIVPVLALSGVIYLSPLVISGASDGVVYASGSTGGGGASRDFPQTDPRASRQQREAERLYNQGRKLFRKRIDCDDSDCLVGEDVIDRDNAVDYLIKFNSDEQFTNELDKNEIRALSVYMIRRYRIEIQ